MSTPDKQALQHPTAVVDADADIGERTRVGPSVRIEGGARVGADCVIAQGALIESGASIGNRVIVQAGARVLSGARVEDEVFIGPNVVLVNEHMSHATGPKSDRAAPVVRTGASIGANATVLAGLAIGRDSVVGAGSVVTRDVPPNAIVAGNPARLQSYVGTPS